MSDAGGTKARLARMRVAELRELASEHGLAWKKLRKAELVELLLPHESGAAKPKKAEAEDDVEEEDDDVEEEEEEEEEARPRTAEDFEKMSLAELRAEVRALGLVDLPLRPRLIGQLVDAEKSGRARRAGPGGPGAGDLATRADLLGLTVPELKDLLRGAGKATSGRKAELVERAVGTKRSALGEIAASAKRRRADPTAGPFAERSRTDEVNAAVRPDVVAAAVKMGLGVPKSATKAGVIPELLKLMPPHPVPLAPSEQENAWATRLPARGGLDLVAKFMDAASVASAMAACRQWAIWMRHSPVWRDAVHEAGLDESSDFPLLPCERAPPRERRDYSYRAARNLGALRKLCGVCLRRKPAAYGKECAGCRPAAEEKREQLLVARMRAAGRAVRDDSRLAKVYYAGTERGHLVDRVASILCGAAMLFDHGHRAFSRHDTQLKNATAREYYKGGKTWLEALRAAYNSMYIEDDYSDSDDYGYGYGMFGGRGGSNCFGCGDYCPGRYCYGCDRGW